MKIADGQQKQSLHAIRLVFIGLVLLSVSGVTLTPRTIGQTLTSTKAADDPISPPIGLPQPEYQADFTPVIPNGYHAVSWANSHLVSFGSGEMKEPVVLYDKTGKWLYEIPLEFPGAVRVYAQDAVPTKSGTVVVAASAVNGDGATADMIVEVGKDGIRRIVRTSPFFVDKVCVTDNGTVWAYGQELSADRRGEARAHYPALREYSLDRGEVRSMLDRATVRPPVGVPLNDDFMRCGAGGVFVVSGATGQMIEYDLASGKLLRWPLLTLPNGSHVTGAALTDSGDFYVSTLKPGQNSQTGLLSLRVSPTGQADWTPIVIRPTAHQFLFLVGSDGQDLVYSDGGRTPAVSWSDPAKLEVTK